VISRELAYSHTMEDRLQGAITTPQHPQEVIAQEEETGSDHKSVMCIGWDSVPLLSDVVIGVPIMVVTNSHPKDDTISSGHLQKHFI